MVDRKPPAFLEGKQPYSSKLPKSSHILSIRNLTIALSPCRPGSQPTHYGGRVRVQPLLRCSRIASQLLCRHGIKVSSGAGDDVHLSRCEANTKGGRHWPAG